MKIQITKPQLLEILSRNFNTTVEDVTITGSGMADIIRAEISSFDYNGSQKIAAIKHLRQLTIDNNWNDGAHMGLGDAKWAIENFSLFVAFVEKNDRLPRDGYSESVYENKI